MKRRAFLGALGTLAAPALPLPAVAQSGGRALPLIGILTIRQGEDGGDRNPTPAARGGTPASISASNIAGPTSPDLIKNYAAELVGFRPDVIVATRWH